MFHRRRLDYFTPPPPSPPPPPPLQTPPSLQLPVTPKQESHSSTNLNPSLLIIAIILIIVFFISALIHLILRYLNRRCNSIQEEDDVASNEPVHIATRISSRRVVPEDHRLLIDSLPLFSFNSISGLRSSSADCAVCLSKFEPHDQLRLLPVCCHAFHSNCIDTWLISNHTCPLCRSTVHVEDSDAYLKLISSSRVSSESFRVEIGNISSRRTGSDYGNDRRRSYSIGSFEYLVETDSSEVVIVPSHHRRDSENVSTGKKDETSSSPSPAAMTTTATTEMNNSHNPRAPGSEVAAEVGEGRGWLKEYVDRLASSSSSSISSRALSFRFSGRFFTGSSRRSEAFTGSSRRSNNSAVNAIVNGGSWDLEGNQYGEEIGNFLRWISGV